MERENEKHMAGGKRAQAPKEKKPKKPSRLTHQQKILVAVAAVLAVALVVVAACQSLFVRPTLPGEGDKTTEELDYGEGVRPRADGQRKSKDWYTVLILGRDTGGGGNTDTMLLASYDVTNQKATVMSIPRDTMVNVSWDIKKINSVYNANGGDQKGIKALYKEIAQLVGFEPDYQVVVEWEAVGKIVDAMGGVEFDVPRNMNYDDPRQDLSIHIQKGLQTLTGEQAMGVIRYRHDNNMKYGYPDGDLGRIKTQQSFLKAVVQQMLQVKNITKINQFAKVFQENVETDLGFSNLCWFGQQAVMGGLSVENVNFVTMPNTPKSCWSRSISGMLSYVVPNAQELLELVNNDLSPFEEIFTLSDLDIMSINSDGSVSSTSGYVEDSRAAVAPVKPQKPSHTTDTQEPVMDEFGNVIDPETGEILVPNPNAEPQTPSETEEPTTPPETGDGTTPPESGGTTKPETGGTTKPETGGTTKPETGGTTKPETGGTTKPETGTTTPTPPTEPTEPNVPADPGFAVVEPAPEG